jgi:ATP-dependent Clp protease ATP-binding subunit ClpC
MEPVVTVTLDPTLQNADAAAFEASLNHQVVGQRDAAKVITTTIQSYMAGLSDPDRPISTILLLGPTGVGKTRSHRP